MTEKNGYCDNSTPSEAKSEFSSFPLPPTYSTPGSPGIASTSQESPLLNQPNSTWQQNSSWTNAKSISSLGNLPYLAGMRALASIIIQLGHIFQFNIFFLRSLALTIHFVQGGFFITGTLLAFQATPRKSTSTFSLYEHLPKFFLARWIRLYPAIIFMLAINSYWWYQRYHLPGHLIKMVIRAYFKLTPFGILPTPENPSNPFAHVWFLDVQEHFYVFWALVLPFIARLGVKGRIIALCSLFFMSFYHRLGEDAYNATLPLQLFKMVLGASVYLIPHPWFMIKRYARKASIITLLIFFVLGYTTTYDNLFSERDQRILGDIVGMLLVYSIVLAAMQTAQDNLDRKIQQVEVEKEERWQPLTLLDAKMLKFISRVSYSWYLWQVPLMHLESNFRSGYRSFGPTCEAFVIAMFSTFMIEEPLRAALTKYVKREKISGSDKAQSLPIFNSKESDKTAKRIF